MLTSVEKIVNLWLFGQYQGCCQMCAPSNPRPPSPQKKHLFYTASSRRIVHVSGDISLILSSQEVNRHILKFLLCLLCIYIYSRGKNQVKIENLMDRNTSRLLLVLFKRYYRGASMKPCRRVPLWCSFCNIGVKGHLWKMSKIAIFFI